jgi:hypothetical protein
MLPSREETRIHNEVIDTLMKRRSVRKYTDQQPEDEVIGTIVRAGQQVCLIESAVFRGEICGTLTVAKVEIAFQNPSGCSFKTADAGNQLRRLRPISRPRCYHERAMMQSGCRCIPMRR